MGEEWQTQANEPQSLNKDNDNINGATPSANQVNYVNFRFQPKFKRRRNASRL